MSEWQRAFARVTLIGSGLLVAAVAAAEPLTVDRAVTMALQRNSQVIGAQADVLSAQGSLYGSYSNLLPSVNVGLTRSGTWEKNGQGTSIFGTQFGVTPNNNSENFRTSPTLGVSQWQVLNLSSLAALRGAQHGLRAARYGRTATSNDVVLATKRQFYEVVKAVRLADVATSALRLSRDNERRVRALFEVGSVSRSDLLKAQVQTAQSELDSLTAVQTVTSQRVLLSEQLGIMESEMGEVDTLLAVPSQTYDEAAVLAEAGRNRPDLLAAEARLKAAEASLRAANLSRLPFVSVSGSTTLQPRTNGKTTYVPPVLDTRTNEVISSQSSTSKADRDYAASISLNMNLFSGFRIEGQIASARAGVLSARESRDALRRNLASEVHEAIQAHTQAVLSDQVARSAIESATENLKLTQQKYNVGSATILDLIDAQVQLQRAQSQGVTAAAGIREAEAQIDRVRGGGAR